MNSDNISISFSGLQYKMDKLRPGMSFYELLSKLICEYGKFDLEGIEINSFEFTLNEKQLILSYMLDADDYEYACYSSFRIELVYRNHIKYIDKQINHVIDDLHSQYLSDNYTCVFRHKDNNEPVWRTK